MANGWTIRHIGVTFHDGPISGVVQTQDGYFVYETDDYVELSEEREFQIWAISEQVFELIHNLNAEYETPRYPDWWPNARGKHSIEKSGLVYRTELSLLEEKRGEFIGVATGEDFPFGKVIIRSV